MKVVKKVKHGIGMFQRKHPKVVKATKDAGKLAPLLLG
jgi:hypothetical protein